MILHDYHDMTIEVMQQPKNASVLVGLARSLTMQENGDFNPVSKKACEFLINAEHMSLFEHAVFTFLIQGISRSLLAQITRQRTATITSGSQHYQDHTDRPCAVDLDASDDYDAALAFRNSLTASSFAYAQALAGGYPKEEARQVLPNATTVNILWTLDARNLFYFLRQRLCNRNVLEMRIFAEKLRVILIGIFPELFEWSGPQCAEGLCKQGKMQCQEKTWEIIN